METPSETKRKSGETKRNSGETKRKSGETIQCEMSSKLLIEYLVQEQKKRDREITRLKKHIQSLKKELETYTQFLNENMGYR